MKKNIVKYMIAVLLTGFMVTSCDKYLDIEPRQEISAETAITSPALFAKTTTPESLATFSSIPVAT